MIKNSLLTDESVDLFRFETVFLLIKNCKEQLNAFPMTSVCLKYKIKLDRMMVVKSDHVLSCNRNYHVMGPK